MLSHLAIGLLVSGHKGTAMGSGEYSKRLREKIRANQVPEKLQLLAEALRPAFPNNSISGPDLTRTQDPCIWLEGFSTTTRLMIKGQPSGYGVVLNLHPAVQGSDAREAFAREAEKAHFDTAEAIIKRGYVQTHDFKTKERGLAGGASFNDVNLIIKLIQETITQMKNSR